MCDNMAKHIIVTADKINRRKKIGRIVKLSLLLLLLLLIVVYIILGIIYNIGNFTITLDSNKTLESGIAIYENLDDPTPKRKLQATAVPFMDNISWKWLPEDIDTKKDGSHNGENYIAYSFYVENQGSQELHYWYEIALDEVMRNVDEAIRIMIYQNGNSTIYAKENNLSGEPEENTIAFLKNKGNSIILEKRTNFSPNDRDRYTIVVWLEGDDPDCVDALLGGGVKMHMNLREEHIEKK